MYNYKHLWEKERETIYIWLQMWLKQYQIAKIIFRHPSTICREIKRNRCLLSITLNNLDALLDTCEYNIDWLDPLTEVWENIVKEDILRRLKIIADNYKENSESYNIGNEKYKKKLDSISLIISSFEKYKNDHAISEWERVDDIISNK